MVTPECENYKKLNERFFKNEISKKTFINISYSQPVLIFIMFRKNVELRKLLVASPTSLSNLQ